MPLRIAHRGMPRRRRENTLPGFSLAMELGAQGIELDTHVTRDGVVVVHHDPALADGTVIAEATLAELRRRDASSEAPLPTLAEVCALVEGRAELFVELKGAGIEAGVMAVLQGYTGAAALHSFDHAMIARLHASSCPWPLGVLFEEPPPDLAAMLAATGATDVWPHHPLVTAALVRDVHARGGRVIPWTVNDADAARRLTAFGVDGLCGDDVTIFPR